MPSIEQMSPNQLSKALYKSLKGTRYEIDKERAKILSSFAGDPKWVPSLQKMIDGQFDGAESR